MNNIKVSWLYPDILNLHGDRGNLMALERIGKALNVNINIEKIDNYDKKINFEETDIIFINPGELKVMPQIIETLEKQKSDLENYIEKRKNYYTYRNKWSYNG